MSFDPIPTLNQQIMTAIGETVADGTEKQNAADAIEAAFSGLVKEVLNDTLRDDIVNNHDSHAIVSVDNQNVVTVQSATPNAAKLSQDAIAKEARRGAIDAALQAADQQNILGEQHDDFVANLNA